MALRITQTADERLVGPPAIAALRLALRQDAQALVLCPSLALALEVQRSIASLPDLSMGVVCTTPQAWTHLRWGLYGDGRTPVTAPQRVALMAELLAEAGDVSPLDSGEGTVEVLCQLASRALPWLPGEDSTAAVGLTDGQARALSLTREYATELATRALVEPCEVLALLPTCMADQGCKVAACVMLGFEEFPRALREFALALAKVAPLEMVVRADAGPEGEIARHTAAQLAAAGRDAGIMADAPNVPQVRDADSAAFSAPGGPAAPSPRRTPELRGVLASLFRPRAGEGLRPTGAVCLLEPAGPLAVAELTCRHVERLVQQGMQHVVVVVPDVEAVWKALAPKLYTRGLTVRAQLSCPAIRARAAAGLLCYAEALARLSVLDTSWPDDPSAPLPDMSWWPPRDVSDFLLCRVSGVGVERVWARDASWRGNRILTPHAVLDTLTNRSATSPALASATRELLRGHLGAAALRLAGIPLARQQTRETTASIEEGVEIERPIPCAEEALAAEQDAMALAALAEVGRALRDAGVVLKDSSQDGVIPGKAGVSLTRFVALARSALGSITLTCRPELTCPGSPASVELMSARDAACRAPLSADAVIYLGLDSATSSIPEADGALEELLRAVGVEEPVDALARARAEVAAIVRVPTSHLALVRPVRDAAAAKTYPSVMLSEIIACYATRETTDAKEVSLLEPFAGSQFDEGLIEENLAASGAPLSLHDVPGAASAGRLDESLRRLVVVPRDGQAELPGGRPMLSASQIESYLECPCKWFTLRRLGLSDCDAGFSNLEMGSFAHRVLEVTHRSLFLEAAQRVGLVGEECAEQPEESLVWFDPTRRVPGSRVDQATLERATVLLREEFAAHLKHQRLEGGTRSKQALVPHFPSEQRRLDELERDLESTLAFESGLFAGFEPRLFEGRFGGATGFTATYAGADLVGTIDRIDVDAEGRALVIDYKHKSSLFDEYALLSGGETDWEAGFVLPRHVQTLVYASVARNLLQSSGIEIVGALYLGTRGTHELSGAVAAHDVDAVWGAGGLSQTQRERVTLPMPGARTFDELLDRTEERIAQAIDQMRAGVIDARPSARSACDWCPVLSCEKRLS